MNTVINCAHTGKENLLAARGVWESVEQYLTCVLVSIHVSVQQCLCNREFWELFRAVSIGVCVLHYVCNYEVLQHCTKHCSVVSIFTLFRTILEKNWCFVLQCLCKVFWVLNRGRHTIIFCAEGLWFRTNYPLVKSPYFPYETYDATLWFGSHIRLSPPFVSHHAVFGGKSFLAVSSCDCVPRVMQVPWIPRISWPRHRSWRSCDTRSWSSCMQCAPWRSLYTSSQNSWRMAACWSTCRVCTPHIQELLCIFYGIDIISAFRASYTVSVVLLVLFFSLEGKANLANWWRVFPQFVHENAWALYCRTDDPINHPLPHSHLMLHIFLI